MSVALKLQTAIFTLVRFHLDVGVFNVVEHVAHQSRGQVADLANVAARCRIRKHRRPEPLPSLFRVHLCVILDSNVN